MYGGKKIKWKKRYAIFLILCLTSSIFLQLPQNTTHAKIKQQTNYYFSSNQKQIDENQEPYVSFFIGPNTRQVNQPVIILVVVRDPDLFDHVKVSIWWRDGDWEMSPYKSSPGIFFMSHTYSKKGTYEVRAIPWDESNTLGISGSCPITII